MDSHISANPHNADMLDNVDMLDPVLGISYRAEQLT